MRAVAALQERTSGEPVKAHYPLRGRDPDRNQTGQPPPGWPGTSGYGSIFRQQF
jgi:hypothetical protein